MLGMERWIMRVVHIAVAGITDKFYLKFLSKMGNALGIEQCLYIPHKKGYSDKEMSIVDQYKKNDVETIALPIKTDLDRVLYYKKIKKYTKHIEDAIDIKGVSLFHAHSLFTDGGVAYLLHKKYGIPYVVAVRTTDTCIFMKYFKHLIPFGRKIIQNATDVVYITPSLRNDTINKMFKGKNNQFDMVKSHILPNGVNEYWIENRVKVGKLLDERNKVRLIQVSRLNPQKNVDKTIVAVSLLRNRGLDVTLDILGEGESREKLENMVEELGISEYVKFYGFIDDLNNVKTAYRSNDVFVMPSLGETFGLTYIEAMSQGLPIIGIQGTGVSDFFENGQVGQFLTEASGTQIADAVINIVKQYEEISNRCILVAEKFSWDTIIAEYSDIYRESERKQKEKV